jgi:hypothetical protein
LGKDVDYVCASGAWFLWVLCFLCRIFMTFMLWERILIMLKYGLTDIRSFFSGNLNWIANNGFSIGDF